MIYRLSFHDEEDQHQGFAFAGSRRKMQEIKKVHKNQGYQTKVDVWKTPKTKDEVLRLLRKVATHPDNG